ncbi:hypothetical protein [Thermoactinomyces intermedius]|uniref:hypothetical protein n=1 Tax=Thermoactinomyces intermedius TaxID=2024 RepID=UPI001E42A1F9|nr:hypothetical protein [Thermoactinomyces intermedius]
MFTRHSELIHIFYHSRAFGGKPEQYPMVGETLIEDVKDALGDGATGEIIQAWVMAYDSINSSESNNSCMNKRKRKKVIGKVSGNLWW